MADEHYNANIDVEARQKMERLANMRFNGPIGTPGDSHYNNVTDAIARAGETQLSRLKTSLHNKTIENAQQTLDNLADTLSRAAMDESFELGEASADQINKILTENGRSAVEHLSSNYGLSTEEAESKINALTGLRVPHERQTLKQRHPEWQQATKRGRVDGVLYNEGDWVEMGTSDDGINRVSRKLSPEEAREAQRWQDEDLDIRRAKEQQDDNN